MIESATVTQAVMPWTIIEDALRRVNDPRTARVAVVLHGGPGSGKTWVRERMGFRPGELAVVVDQDREREATPKRDEESDADYSTRLRDISRERMDWAIGRGAPLYVEGLSCDPRRTILVLAALRDAGYYVVMVGLDCGKNVARERLRERETVDGRHVDDEVIVGAYNSIPSAWKRFDQLVDEFALFDMDADPPIRVAPYWIRTPIEMPESIRTSLGLLAPTDPPRTLREALASMLPKPYAELADLAVRLSDAVGRSKR